MDHIRLDCKNVLSHPLEHFHDAMRSSRRIFLLFALLILFLLFLSHWKWSSFGALGMAGVDSGAFCMGLCVLAVLRCSAYTQTNTEWLQLTNTNNIERKDVKFRTIQELNKIERVKIIACLDKSN